MLNPLASNEFCSKDIFDAVERLKNIPQHLFDEDFRFVSFDVKSLFTNIPLNKTIDIIFNKIYKQNKLKTAFKKRTLKKLLRDACTKTPFSINGELYRQIDGVSMGSPLSPTLANIIMTALEDEIVRDLIDQNVIKFYTRYVDDTLVTHPLQASLVSWGVERHTRFSQSLYLFRVIGLNVYKVLLCLYCWGLTTIRCPSVLAYGLANDNSFCIKMFATDLYGDKRE